MPLIDLFATACDWLVADVGIPAGLAWFLALSYFNLFSSFDGSGFGTI